MITKQQVINWAKRENIDWASDVIALPPMWGEWSWISPTERQAQGRFVNSKRGMVVTPFDIPTEVELTVGRTVTVAHYQHHYKGIKLDPYRICDVYNVGGGAREQIIKKGLRWTEKGDSERAVIKEIMQACERRLEMLDEDEA